MYANYYVQWTQNSVVLYIKRRKNYFHNKKKRILLCWLFFFIDVVTTLVGICRHTGEATLVFAAM